MSVKLYQGDNSTILPTLKENSIDSIVTDPPYGFGNGKKSGFMNKEWDYDVPSVELWIECLRILKPGGYLLSFAGARTHHRMVNNIEKAGFEIIDVIFWTYSTGFPKSLDISKAIDAQLLTGGSHSTNIKQAISERPGEARETATLPNNGIVSGKRRGGLTNDNIATDEAKKWLGWGTALKPAHEPITIAKKTGSPFIDLFPKKFFYHGKATKKERRNSKHPTLKPVGLMKDLVKMVTPLNGITIDPFAGSGTTGEAAVETNRHAILIEREEEYSNDIRDRLFLFLEEDEVI